MSDERIYMLGVSPVPPVDQVYDLRRAMWFDLIGDALRVLVQSNDRVIKITGTCPKTSAPRWNWCWTKRRSVPT